MTSTGSSVSRPSEPAAVAERQRLGMWLFLASLGMLFGGSLVGFLVIRLRADQWPPPGSPGLPASFHVSTALLVIISVALIAAERAVRSRVGSRATALLCVAATLGAGFILSQVAGWARLAAASVVPQDNLFLFGVYVLSFLHVLHVVGGMVALVWVTLRSRGGRYTSVDHGGVTLTGMYWHFLLVVWIGILAVLALRPVASGEITVKTPRSQSEDHQNFGAPRVLTVNPITCERRREGRRGRAPRARGRWWSSRTRAVRRFRW